MKFILVVLIIAQLHGAFSASGSLQEQRGFLEFWDLISPVAIPIAHGIDTAIGTISNIHSSISNAVSDAIYGVTSWIGDKIPALGKRDLENDARFNLLNELTTFKASFQQSIVEIFQSFLSGNFATKLQQAISKLVTFLNTHLQKISTIITNLIPTMDGTLATQAMTSSLHVIEVIQEVIRKIHAFFSS